MAKSALLLSIAATAALSAAPTLAQSYDAGAHWSGSYEEQSSQAQSYESHAYQSRGFDRAYRRGVVHRTTDAAGFLTWSGKDGERARVDDRYGPPAPFEADDGYARTESFHGGRAIRIADEDFAYESSSGPMFMADGGGGGGGGGSDALAGASAFAGASASASAYAKVSVQVRGYGGGGYRGGGHRHGHMPSGCGCKK